MERKEKGREKECIIRKRERIGKRKREDAIIKREKGGNETSEEEGRGK